MTYICVIDLFLFLNLIQLPVSYICYINLIGMTTKELQNSIVEKVLNSRDKPLLIYLNHLLEEGDSSEIYKLTDLERAIISESRSDYISGNVISNDDVILRNREWLEE